MKQHYARHLATGLYFDGINFSAKTIRTAHPIRKDLVASDFWLTWGRNVEIVVKTVKRK